MGILSGLIDVNNQAVNTILVTLIAIMFMIPVGIQSAACALVGEQIGANQVVNARAYFKLMSFFVLGIILVVQAIFYFAKGPIVKLFTNDAAVEELAISCIYIVIIAFFPDCIQGSIQGVIRALNV